MSELNENIHKLKLGDEAAFAFLYSEFESALINHLYKMLGRVEKAEEVFQDVMITMIKKINHYEHRPELKNSFKAWIFRIATNHAIDELRKSKKQKLIFSDEHTTDIADEIIEIDLSERLGDLIMSLPVIQRTFLNLKIKEDLSHLEIAAICGCNVNAVKQGLFRARKSLKDLILREGLEI
jgi:RNA polymerase sigma-70 factor (ECF subfamily)